MIACCNCKPRGDGGSAKRQPCQLLGLSLYNLIHLHVLRAGVCTVDAGLFCLCTLNPHGAYHGHVQLHAVVRTRKTHLLSPSTLEGDQSVYVRIRAHLVCDHDVCVCIHDHDFVRDHDVCFCIRADLVCDLACLFDFSCTLLHHVHVQNEDELFYISSPHSGRVLHVQGLGHKAYHLLSILFGIS